MPPSDPNSPPQKPPDIDTDATVVVNDLEAAAVGVPSGSALPASTPASHPTGSTPLSGRLQEGDLLADGRYRIGRFLGEGGMGSVYEATDLELGVRLALKTLRPESTVASALERFKREIHVARQVTHPNVCRLYDLGRHRLAEGQDLFFLTMQYLEGETLRERLSRDGRLTPAEAHPLVRDMAAALDAAHQVGIVHRDFKSGNVMLVPSREGLRAVVTDFGLARELDDSGRETLTRTAGFVGTPAYSSPEQIQGLEVGPESDIYAFGVVLYEMTTGRLPFDDAPTAWIAVVRRLNEMPAAPQMLVPELPDSWNAVILRCLQRQPEDRFAAAWDVAEALEVPFSELPTVPLRAPASPVVPPSGTGSRPFSRPRTGSTAVQIPVGFDTASLPAVPPPDRARPRELILIACGALLLIFGLVFAWLRPDLPSPTPEKQGPDTKSGVDAGQVQNRRTIAMLGFKNLKGSGEAAWISTALSEMLAMEVASGDTLRVIPSEVVARMKSEMRLGDDEGYSAERLSQIRENLGSDLVVLGTFLSESDVLRLDLRVQDASGGEVLSRISEKGKESDLISLVERVGSRLRSELGMTALGPDEAQAVRAAFPESTEVARIYAEGLAHLRRFELVEATRLLEKAAEKAPKNAMVLMALSDTYELVGHEEKASRAARQAFESSQGLPVRYAKWIEAIHYEAAHQWEPAIATFQALWKLYPDDLEVGLRLAKLLGRSGRFEDVLATCDRLESLPPPAGTDPRVDLLKIFALLNQAQADRALAVAEGAALEGHARGAVITEASANAYMGAALLARGQHAEALRKIEKARELFLSVGYREGAAQTITTMARVLEARGEWTAARRRYEESISLLRQIGATAKLRTSLAALATHYYQRGELRESARLLEECLVMAEGLESPTAIFQRHHGEILARLGDLEKGRRVLDASWDHALKSNNRKLQANLQESRGLLAVITGELRDAESHFDKAAEFFRQTGQVADEATVTLWTGKLDLVRGDLSRARTMAEKVASLRAAESHELIYMERRLLLAAIALAEGRLEEAESLYHEQIRVSPEQQLVRFEVEALAGLAQIELKRLAEASTGADSARAAAATYTARITEALPGLEDLWRQLLGQIAVERTRALLGDSGAQKAAMARIRSLRAEAERRGLQPVVFEAELALGEIEAAGPDQAAGRSRLLRLKTQAETRGFGDVARRAELAAR